MTDYLDCYLAPASCEVCLTSTLSEKVYLVFVWGFVTSVIWQVLHVEQELPTLSEYPSSPLVFYGVCVARSLVFCVMFCRSLFVLLSFFFCVVCLFFNYSFWLPFLVTSNFSCYMYVVFSRSYWLCLSLKLVSLIQLKNCR
jgi:hypothetical protein